MRNGITSRELIKKALNFELCERIPTDRDDATGPMFTYGIGRTSGVPEGTKGIRYDQWGVKWEASEDGVSGEVKGCLIDDWSKLADFTPPYDVLDETDFTGVDEFCAATDKFIIPMWWANYNLFERMQNLRGTEQLLMDIADGEDEIYQLRKMVHDYFMRQGEMWAKTGVDGIHIADDWGSQTSLLISPDTWRRFFKPCYKEYCDMAHAHGKYVVFHSDGNIESIIGDLVEIGVNAVNSQLFCMDMEKIAAQYHGKIAFWGELDRQFALPFGTTDDCRKAVRKVADTFLKYGRTGIIGQAFWGKDIPAENLDAVYDEWSKI